MIKHLLFFVSSLTLTLFSRTGEGMWLPRLLGQFNEKQMKGLGMKISAAVDKYAGATNLIKEMKLVHPKKKS